MVVQIQGRFMNGRHRDMVRISIDLMQAAVKLPNGTLYRESTYGTLYGESRMLLLVAIFKQTLEGSSTYSGSLVLRIRLYVLSSAGKSAVVDSWSLSEPS